MSDKEVAFHLFRQNLTFVTKLNMEIELKQLENYQPLELLTSSIALFIKIKKEKKR
jgi:hypothetical protein